METRSNVVPLRRGSPGISDEAFAALKQLHNIEAEQALLGGLLINNTAYDAVCDKLSFEDFSHPLHGEIYAAIGSLIASGGVANPITLNAYFAATDTYLAHGGSSYLAKLAMNAVTVINAPYYAETIRDLARRRTLVEVAQALVNDAAVPLPDRQVDAVLEDVEQQLYKVGAQDEHRQARPLAAVAAQVIDNTEAAYKAGGAVVVDTGLIDLDKILRGMAAGDLIVLAGRPSMGKSACAGTVAKNAAKLSKTVMMFSLEMTAEELGQRWLASETGIPTEKLRHGDLDMTQWPALVEAQAAISRLPIVIDDQPRLSVAAMRQRAQRQLRRGKLDLIIVDHLQQIRQGGRQESRRLEIGDATSSLKAIAKQLGLPVLLLSQLNRKVEDRENKRPSLADLRESGDIEQDADVVLLLYREEYYLEKTGEPLRRARQTYESWATEVADFKDKLRDVRGLAELAVAKNRHGPTGLAKVFFDAQKQSFENLTAASVR